MNNSKDLHRSGLLRSDASQRALMPESIWYHGMATVCFKIRTELKGKVGGQTLHLRLDSSLTSAALALEPVVEKTSTPGQRTSVTT